MAYKENIGSCIAIFDQSVEKSGLLFDTERKLLSILRSLEYQVEIGVCPVPVALHLKEAMQAWIEASGNKHKSLSKNLNKCVDVVLNEIGGTEPGA